MVARAFAAAEEIVAARAAEAAAARADGDAVPMEVEPPAAAVEDAAEAAAKAERLAKLKAKYPSFTAAEPAAVAVTAPKAAAPKAGAGWLRCVQCVAPAPAEAPRLSMPEASARRRSRCSTPSVALLAA